MIDPYSKITTVEMWTDEYISKQMLKAHLDGTMDAASRNSKTISKTVNFINNYLGTPSTICDYGCGPGLYANPLQKLHHKVIGVDVSSNSLQYAKTVNNEVDYIKMNYVDESINEKVDFAMMIYCDFGALDPVSQRKTLRNIHSSLQDDGVFFFDVASYQYYEAVKEDYFVKTDEDGFFMRGTCKVTTHIVKYPQLKLVLHHQHAVGEREIHLYNWDKCYGVEEMKILLNDNGFDIVDVYSNTYGEKEYNDSNTLAFVCKKL